MNDTTDSIAIFAPLWRRKWLILAVGIVVAGATYAYYKRKPTVFSATTQVYLSNSAEEASQLEGTASGGGSKKNSVSASNQTAIINSPLVHEVVKHQLAHLQSPLGHAALRGKVHAKGAEKSAFISVTAEARTARAAALLANATARAYIARQGANYRRAVNAAIALTRKQLRRVETALSSPVTTSKGKKTSGASSTAATLQSATLNSKINQLEADLSAVGARQISPARAANATLLSPHPKKNAIFGFVLGVVLAAVAVYALSRFDRRLRSPESIETVFRSRILTALPTVRRTIVRRDGELTPSKFLSEPLRRLHATIHLGELQIPTSEGEGSRRSILFLSADAGDGTSTLTADLALIQRDAGERVALLEADFRRSVQAKLLGVEGRHGLAQVLAGALPVERAMEEVVPLGRQASVGSTGSPAGAAVAVKSRSAGTLSVLVSGGSAANPPALLAGQPMTELLQALAAEFDSVLIDAPSPLEASDAMPLLRLVDGIVIVARFGHTREASAQRLVQLLTHTSTAPILGVVVNDVPPKEIEKYGFSMPKDRRWYQLLSRR
jgi:Mrp family chromosome partitioning ATPase/capsular polysaccharide biosynthesis protein